MITAGKANALACTAKRYGYEINALIGFIEREIIINAAHRAKKELVIDFDSKRYEKYPKIKEYISNQDIIFNIGIMFEEYNYKVEILKREDGTIKGLVLNWNLGDNIPRISEVGNNDVLNSLL